MTHLGWLCALAWACLPLHAAAQSGEMGNTGEAAMSAAPVPAVAPPDTQPIADPNTEPATGRGLKPQGTQPARWPDDLTLSPDRPDPVGLRATPDALPGPASGLASWYADHFHGRRTASGERYSRYEMTAAHRDLPLGTLLHVSNPETGVGVVVRVNDRGPFHGDRVLDVSRAAASVLGLVGVGVGQVDIRLPSSEEVAEFARRLAEAAKRPPAAAKPPPTRATAPARPLAPVSPVARHPDRPPVRPAVPPATTLPPS